MAVMNKSVPIRVDQQVSLIYVLVHHAYTTVQLIYFPSSLISISMMVIVCAALTQPILVSLGAHHLWPSASGRCCNSEKEKKKP